jgi:hypothetical protein
LALLAAYPEEQEKAIQEINEVWPSSGSTFEPFYSNTSMDDYAKFPFILACYSETLRLFPPVQMIPKIAARDVEVTVESTNDVAPSSLGLSLPSDAKEMALPTPHTSFVVQKGTVIFIDPPGVRE